jgi:hypothetical protein
LALFSAAPAMHAQSRPGIGITACDLLSAAEIQRIVGRADVATVPAQPENMEFHSNCIRRGAFDLGITIASETPVMFARMRDTYAKAPTRLGYTVEKVSGIGTDAYFLIDKDRVQLKALLRDKELTIAVSKISMLPGRMPPPPEAKAIARELAKAGVTKLR